MMRNAPVRRSRAPRGACDRRLSRDSSGAILLLGIALGTALAAALFYLVNIGEGILWRESAQNAADAAAFENAVWHARGMNMIATLNISLSLLSAVIVMWRLTILALGFATLTDLVSSMLQPGAERASPSLPLSPLVEMLMADDHVAETLASAAKAVSAAQVAVATYTPLLATQVRSPELNVHEEAMETATFSGSLLPAEDPTARTNNRLIALDADVSESDVRHQNGSSSAFKRLGAPFSLPVQAGSHSLLCPRLPEGFSQRSTMLVQRLPREWRNRLLSASRLTDGKALDQLGVTATGAGVFSLMESLYSLPEAPALLCARPGPTMDYLKQVLWKIAERANDESSVKDAVLSDSIRQHVRGRGLPLTSVQEAKALFAHWQSSFELDATALRFGSPAEVWLKAQNGNVYLRSTAVVSANVAALATTPFPDSSAPKRSRARIWAHAETYFACTKSWHECRSDALWRLEWRARLRRVQPYASLLRQAGARPAEPSQLEDTVVNWLERSARPLGPSWRSPRVRGFVPDFEPIPVRDTRTFRSREMSHGRAAEDASLDEFLAREGTANSVIH